MRFHFIGLLAIVAGTVLGFSKDVPKEEIEDLHFLFNMTPESSTNPAIARVEECGIAIPLSEFRSYMDMEGPLEPKSRVLSLEDKRKCLNRLIDEHLLLWNAYQQRWDQTDRVISGVKETRNLMLMEFLLDQEVIAKAGNAEDYNRLARELVDRCFDKTEVVVSNESYEELKTALRKLNVVSTSKGAETNKADSRPPSLDSFSPELLGRPLANCKLGVATIGDVLGVYFDMPPSSRPAIEMPDGVSAMLKALMRDALLAAEAEARGFHLTKRFREGLQINRNVLTRFYFQDRLTDRAVARTKEANYEDRLRKWYQDQLRTRYTRTDSNGKKQTVLFDAERESIANDFFEILREEARADEVRALRKGRKIWMDEARLDARALSSRSSNDDDPISQTTTAK